MEKNKILSKLNIKFKDYNNELEKILENKLFSYEAKNLLLSMLYKIENAYKDYETVKVEVPTKKEYIENLLRIIQEKALKILIVKVGTDEAKELEKAKVTYKIDKNNGEIVCFQNEMVILEALLKLDETNVNFETLYEYIKEPIEEMFNQGKIESYLEVERDFNGWSWDIVTKEIKNIEYNFLYQNLILLYGRKLNGLKGNITENIMKMAIKKYSSDEHIKKLEDIRECKKKRLKLFENKKDIVNEM